MMPCKRMVSLVVLLLITIAAPPASAAERSQERVRIGVSSRSIGFFDTWVAHEKGFFRKRGIDSEVITIRPNLSVIALQVGEIDYSWMTGTVIRAAVKGLSLKLVTIGLKSSFHTLVAQPNIASVGELRGKKIAVSNVGATDDLVARALLQKADWTRAGMPQCYPWADPRRAIKLCYPDRWMRRRCLCRIQSLPNKKAFVSSVQPGMCCIFHLPEYRRPRQKSSASAIRSSE